MAKFQTWLILAVLGSAVVRIQEPPPATAPAPSTYDPRFETLVLKNGSRLEGLVVAETPNAVRFKVVLRQPGGRTHVIETEFELEEIASLQRLPLAERQQTAAYLERRATEVSRRLARQREVKLASVPAQEGLPAGRRCTTRWFVLTGDVNDDLLQQIAVRLEDLLAAAATRFDVAKTNPPPLQITVLRRWEDYWTWQRRRRLRILNPAYYDPQRKELVAVCEVDRLAADLAAEQQRTKAKLAELDEYERKLRRHFGGPPPAELVAKSREQRLQLLSALNENEILIERQKANFFTVLTHEAAHAFLDVAVYPSATHALPRWLNEGLAQLFEQVVVEEGQVFWGRLDAERLQAAQQLLRRGELPALVSILQDDPRVFKVDHLTQTLQADRQYLAAWALTYWLVVERATPLPALSRYAAVAGKEADKAGPFITLLGLPLEKAETDFREWLGRVRPDGTLR